MNIAINKDIQACATAAEACAVVLARAAEMNAVNISTAFRKLLLAQRAGNSTQVELNHAMRILEDRATTKMQSFGPREIANTLYIIAKKDYRDLSSNFISCLAKRTEEAANDFNPQHVTNTLKVRDKMAR